MIRPLHRWVGLALALVVSVTALSGAILALYPAMESFAIRAGPELDLAAFTARVQEAVPGLEQIRRAATGQITAFAFEGGVASQWIDDPGTGAVLSPATQSAFESWVLDLHRAFLAGETGRYAAAVASLAMIVLSASGFLLAARRLGGWRRLFGRLSGPLANRLHLELGRLGGIALMFSALTGLWLFALTVGLISESSALPAFPMVSGTGGLSPAEMSGLKEIAVSDLRELTFPRAGNLRDVFTLQTSSGTGYVDQGTGEMIAWSARSTLDRLSDVIHMLHTGEGAALLGLILGLASLSVPVLSVTGYLQQSGRSILPARFRRNRRKVAASAAHTVILVGSEGGTTFSFAERLARSFDRAGQLVHVASLSDFVPDRYRKAERILILAATSGDGDSPSSAWGFMDRLAEMAQPPAAPFAILGFGDRNYPRFCAYASTVCDAARTAGWPELMPPEQVDRQSEETFAAWVAALAEITGIEITLDTAQAAPKLLDLPLVSRRDYGQAVQTPIAILRFTIPRCTLWRRLTARGLACFEAGDLIGVIPEGDTQPRFYSLASSGQDGFVAICVRKQPGGLCSSQLMDLAPGQTIRAFLRRNPGFHPAADNSPLILIGAGAGIGPLAGFVRANADRRPMHLYFGARSASSDLLYGDEFAHWQQEGKLASLTTAFSRDASRLYVQDALRNDAERLRRLVLQGARIMVCGGRDMGAGVAEALAET
ncbi:PepSY domain-containing protein [Aliiruegeria lutimaris]|uniref:NADPH--hemoprotein reductase n=1 Tax=Aliiruegeria lutimaris TaxID=571298 RepID=A0A1G8IHV5_9RHOB|nr:sulfite reductase (NADPH) flavoprotein alpha-component [Aliiruegeria lutimaris]